MGKEQGNKDLELLERFVSAVETSTGNPESGQGKVHVIVMPDKIILAIHKRVEQLIHNAVYPLYPGQQKENIEAMKKYEELIFRLLEATIKQ